MRYIVILALIVSQRFFLFGNWVEHARSDLHAIYRELSENCPASIDYNNPSFKHWLEEGLTISLEKIKSEPSCEGYKNVLYYYLNGLGTFPFEIQYDQMPETYFWPGFVASLLGDEWIIFNPTKRGKGQRSDLYTKLISCDNKTPQEWIRENLVPFYGGSEEPSVWHSLAPYIFLHRDNPWITKPLQCVVKRGPHLQRLSMDWKPMPEEQARVLADEASFGIVKENFGLDQLPESGFWLTLPTFEISHVSQSNALCQLLEHLARSKNKNLVVIDIRGNKGGNRIWGQRVMEALWGHRYLDSLATDHPLKQPLLIDWRISKDNYVRFTHAHGVENAYNFDQALQRAQAFFTQEFQSLKRPAEWLNSASDDPKMKVVLLTDGRCQGAAWQFARDLIATGRVLHLGSPTRVMSPYVQMASVPLPSGKAVLKYPMAMIRSPRHFLNQALIPADTYEGNWNEDKALRQWVLEKAASYNKAYESAK